VARAAVERGVAAVTVPPAGGPTGIDGTAPSRPDTGLAGVVLAGGRSTRFTGADKAVATLAGKPVVRYVVENLRPVVDSVVVNCRREQQEPIAEALDGLSVGFAEDPITDRGPVAGLRTGLRGVDARYAVVCACDTPFLPPALLSVLASRARTHTGAVAELDGSPLPLPAAVHVRAAVSTCTDVIHSGGNSLREFVHALDPLVLSETEVLAYADRDAFRNINTVEDLRAAAECL